MKEASMAEVVLGAKVDERAEFGKRVTA